MSVSAPPLLALVTAGSVLLTVTLAALAVGYALAIRFWPYTNCPRCSGSGKSGSPTRKKFRNCPRCKGTGRRIRFGRRVFDHFNRDDEGA